MVAARFLALSLWLLLPVCEAQAADIPGSKDPAGFKRYQGSEIVHSGTNNYAQYTLFMPKLAVIEGQLTRTVYREPAGRSTLEIFRNYETMLKDAGYTIIYETPSEIPQLHTVGNYGSDWLDLSFFHLVDGFSVYASSETNGWYLTAKSTKNGQDLTAVVFVFAMGGDARWTDQGAKSPTTLKTGQVVTYVDMVTAKAIENKMVVVKAVDIADALANKGVFDLYGVYFDTDKTDVKSESTATLDEVANLLKIDRSLKLEISGHTDNTGDKAHNLTLSEGRAKAVVNALVVKYGIPAARLQARGYGDTKPVAPNTTDDGRAKNRRVELRKI